MNVYKSRKKYSLNMHNIITTVYIRTVKTLEKRIPSFSDGKSKVYHKKWNVTENKFSV